MSSYTPSLFVSESSHILRIRELPVDGEIKVAVGDIVKADDTVLFTSLIGELEVVRIGDNVGLDGEELKKFLKVAVGQRVEKDEIICEVSTFFGFFKTIVQAPVTGEIEFYNEATGNLGIRLDARPYEVRAYVPGKVKRIEDKRKVELELNCAIIEGVFGIGGESAGTLYQLPKDKIIDLQIVKNIDHLDEKILFGGCGYTMEALSYCNQQSTRGIVTGSIESNIFEEFARGTIGVSMSGFEGIVTPIIFTEGFGELEIGELAFRILASHEGAQASINGLTQVRAGAVRPEVIIPISELKNSNIEKRSGLRLGVRVRVIRGDNFGAYANVIELPIEKTKLPSGADVRVVKIKFDSGVEAICARANIEMLLD